jgi:hypothetical protein
MQLTWEDAQEKIIKNADNHGEKAAKLKECRSWDRSQVDLKEIIHAIADIIDPKRLRWTTRVGQAIGRREPRGELVDFLGKDTIEALWPST